MHRIRAFLRGLRAAVNPWIDPKRFALLMLLQFAQTVKQYVRSCCYDTFHKGEHNFILNILRQDKCHCTKQLLKEFS